MKWGEKPETYTCINCGRSFTQEERENLLENDRELTDSYFHGLTLKEAILERVKKGEGHITLQENGVVTWYQNGVGEAAAPVGQLYGLETKQGRLAGGPALHGLLPGPDAGIQLLADGQRLCLGARV